MEFNSPEFMIIYLPILAVLYRVIPGYLRIPFLLAASAALYVIEGKVPALVLAATVLWTWLAGRLAFRRPESLALVLLGLSAPMAALVFFKYSRFIAGTLGLNWAGSPAAALVDEYGLPAGISFYTFHAISYVVDIKRGKIKAPAPLADYALYIVFFPQLVAGPIIRFNDVGEQFRNLRNRLPSLNLMTGLKYVAVGLAYKTFFADFLHVFKDEYVPGSGFWGGLFNILSYSMVIYYDFWGYSLMAIGIARLFGVELPKNFNEPYCARSPKDFWRRWHITLSFWLRDYVYLPLGGNRAYVRNIAIVFVLCGFWHGAGWNFVVWGAYHGVLVILYHWLRDRWDKLPAFIAVAATYLLVALGWPLFYLSLGDYALLLRDMASAPIQASPYHLQHWGYLGLVMAWTFLVREKDVLFNEKRGLLDNPVVIGLLMFCALSFLSMKRTFIYFQF